MSHIAILNFCFIIFSSSTAFCLFQKSIQPWGTFAEIAQIVNDPHLQKLPERLKLLQKNKSIFFWHLKDPYIGIKYTIKKHQPLAWNFSLWDFCPKKGARAYLAIFDQGEACLKFKMKHFCQFAQNRKNSRVFNIDYEMHDEDRDRFENLKLEGGFFYDFLKNNFTIHATSSISLIQQIAPNCLYNIFGIMDHNGFARSSDFCKLLQTIKSNNFDCVHLGFKLLNNKASDQIEQLLRNIDYVVAAAGNDPLESQEAYPARSLQVTFDIGAYDASYNICPFSQFSNAVGPKLVLPGKDLLCQIGEDIYAYTSGTSMAAALMTGFIALVLAEFKEFFTYNEILDVIYQSTCKIKSTKEWKRKVALGALDMRTSVLCLHVLHNIKYHVPRFQFKKLRHRLISGILLLNKIFMKKDALPKYLHETFIQLAQKRDFASFIQLFTECILKIYNLKIKRGRFKVLFDKDTVCLLRNSIKQAEYIPYKTASNQAKQKIQYALNRKTQGIC